MKKTCQACNYFEPAPAEGHPDAGECHRYACFPEMGTDAAGLRWARWPLVLASTRFCGDFAPLPVREE